MWGRAIMRVAPGMLLRMPPAFGQSRERHARHDHVTSGRSPFVPPSVPLCGNGGCSRGDAVIRAGGHAGMWDRSTHAAVSTPVPVDELRQTPLGEQLEWLISLLNAGADALDPVDLEAHVTPGFLTVLPPETLAGFIQQVGDAYGGLNVQGLTRPPTETQAVALLSGNNGGQLAMAVAIEDTGSHR
jgi:hypothetical protein